MLLNKKLKIFLTYLILTSFTTSSFAQSQVERVQEGQPAPYSGWCLTDKAMALIIADKENSQARCQLRLNEQRDLMSAKYNLDVGTLKARLNGQKLEYEEIVKIKNEEIIKLEKIALEKPNDHWQWFAAGGFLTGVLLTVGIVFAVN